MASNLGLRGLLVLGDFASEFAHGAREAGMPEAAITVASNHDELADAVLAGLRPRDWVLVKGSRAMQMERIVERLTEASGKEA